MYMCVLFWKEYPVFSTPLSEGFCGSINILRITTSSGNFSCFPSSSWGISQFYWTLTIASASMLTRGHTQAYLWEFIATVFIMTVLFHMLSLELFISVVGVINILALLITYEGSVGIPSPFSNPGQSEVQSVLHTLGEVSR